MEEEEYFEDNNERVARESHCEIERRRRNKMTANITELSELVPSCSSLTRKPDKLTILKMSVAHMKSLRGNRTWDGDGSYKPHFLTEKELNQLILEAGDGFLFAVSCDNSQITYVSDSVVSVLHTSATELVGSSIFDQFHPEDVDNVMEQLAIHEVQSKERVLDWKTGTIKKDGHKSSPGMCNRRFICRMKLGVSSNQSDRTRPRNALGVSQDGSNYAVVHCTGNIKKWPRSVGVHLDGPSGEDANYCLVAIGRLQRTSPSSNMMMHGSPPQFITRHSIDGKFTFVEERVMDLLGYSPQEMLGKCCFDLVHQEDSRRMREAFDEALKQRWQTISIMCRYQTNTLEWIWLRASIYALINPDSGSVEYITCTNTSAMYGDAREDWTTTRSGNIPNNVFPSFADESEFHLYDERSLRATGNASKYRGPSRQTSRDNYNTSDKNLPPSSSHGIWNMDDATAMGSPYTFRLPSGVSGGQRPDMMNILDIQNAGVGQLENRHTSF